MRVHHRGETMCPEHSLFYHLVRHTFYLEPWNNRTYSMGHVLATNNDSNCRKQLQSLHTSSVVSLCRQFNNMMSIFDHRVGEFRWNTRLWMTAVLQVSEQFPGICRHGISGVKVRRKTFVRKRGGRRRIM